MTHKQFLKKQIIYRSTHRGSKEMDILLGQFVKKYINDLNNLELESLNEMLSLEDEILHNFLNFQISSFSDFCEIYGNHNF